MTMQLIPRLAAFRAADPGIELAILAAEALANLQSDGVDRAVRQGRPPFGPALIADLPRSANLKAACRRHMETG